MPPLAYILITSLPHFWESLMSLSSRAWHWLGLDSHISAAKSSRFLAITFITAIFWKEKYAASNARYHFHYFHYARVYTWYIIAFWLSIMLLFHYIVYFCNYYHGDEYANSRRLIGNIRHSTFHYAKRMTYTPKQIWLSSRPPATPPSCHWRHR